MNESRPAMTLLTPRRPLIGVMLAAALATGLAASASLGQQSVNEMRPPSVTSTGEPPVVRMYLVTALIGGIVIGANLIPSKRGHQD